MVKILKIDFMQYIIYLMVKFIKEIKHFLFIYSTYYLDISIILY